ncbi:MAG TPA: hypothetical protein VFZ34_26410 [Blastocatellia bacterium]|nr:hypothetical protein [Blastocatellia bacterium]
MGLLTRQNPDTDALEVFVNEQWVPFQEYRDKQIADAYEKSVVFLRERLGEDEARKTQEKLDKELPNG